MSSSVGVASEEKVETVAGTFDSFILSYKLDDETSRIWMVASMPLPVKAATFDEENGPHYSFDLQQVSRIGLPEESL